MNRLKEIQTEIAELLDESEYIIRTSDRDIYDRAKAYWIAHIKMALYNDTEYLGKSQVTMEDTIDELSKINEDVEEDE